jgi:hypothetical protein
MASKISSKACVPGADSMTIKHCPILKRPYEPDWLQAASCITDCPANGLPL